MAHFQFNVSGNLIIEADSHQQARELLQAMLHEKAPWLQIIFGTRVGTADHDVAERLHTIGEI